jgi:hypothetical protein
MQKVQDEQQLRLVLRGYADSVYAPVLLSLQVSGDAPYRIPVRIAAPAEINGSEGMDTESGLLVVRDSCYNNVVVQNGVVVSSPWPQPASQQISLRVLSPGKRRLTLRVLDALGRDISPSCFSPEPRCSPWRTLSPRPRSPYFSVSVYHVCFTVAYPPCPQVPFPAPASQFSCCSVFHR